MAANKITKELYGGKVTVEFYPDSHRYKLLGEKTYLISATAMTGILDKSLFLIPWAIGLAKSHLLKYLDGKQSITPEELYPIIDKAVIQHTQKKEEAGDIGSQIHDWCDAFAASKIEGTTEPEITDDMDQRVLNGISAFLDFYNNHDVKFLEHEKLTYSITHGWVGITDAVAMVDGVKTVIDYKTGKYIYDEQYFQMGQYWISLNEEYDYLMHNMLGDVKELYAPIKQAMILNFRKDDDLVSGKKGGELTIGLLTEEDQSLNTPVIKALFTIKKRLKELASKKPYVSE
jgi:hypothetical protein